MGWSKDLSSIPIPWALWAVIGTAWTFGVGVCFRAKTSQGGSLRLPRIDPPQLGKPL